MKKIGLFPGPMVTSGILVVMVLWIATSGSAQEPLMHDYPVRPVPFSDVTLTDTFWAPRQRANREKSIPYAFEQCEKTGRVENFLLAAERLRPTGPGGSPRVSPEYRYTVPVFNDTDIYKGIEAASCDMAVHPDPEMDAYVDRLIAIVADAQESDGYLYTAITCGQDFPDLHGWAHGGKWKNLAMSHELYCAGHMFESAAAHHTATGKRNFLDVATRLADLLVKTFGPDRQTQIQDVPGHEVIEMGLVKLYRVTGKQEYLAKFFVDMRGRADLRHSRNEDPGRMYGEYSQDHRPLTLQDEAVGHAVRATYYYAGAADVAALTGDQATLDAVHRIWENVVSKKLYLIGGLGGTPHGEAFAANYDLPNFSGYSETCAQIGGSFWHHRMFLLDDDAKYCDVLERTIYNGLISGVSLSGDQFFYPNQQASRGGYRRAPWFGCACCPQNLMRFVASLSGYIYAVKDDTLYVGLYIANEGTAEVA
ncbi:MAG: glycoside hydrolase family 127 protein, partial [Planctomycetia bacterium]|nr:glycoside hydrolase family 127 protein [Planctomycetia bacterium]